MTTTKETADIVERLRLGYPCAEIGEVCRTMDSASGCACA